MHNTPHLKKYLVNMYFESLELGESLQLATFESETPLLPRSHTIKVSMDEDPLFSIINTLCNYNSTCCDVGGLPGQQPVLGIRDHFSKVCSGGSQVFNLLLHSGQYLHRVGHQHFFLHPLHSCG